MYTRFEIVNFRGFDHLMLDPLARVNLIAGKNNVGKTALLEALFLHIGAHNPELPLRVNAIRGIERFPLQPDEVWGWFFYDKRTDRSIQICSLDDQGLNRSLAMRLAPSETVTQAGNGNGSRSRPTGFITTDVSTRPGAGICGFARPSGRSAGHVHGRRRDQDPP
ncbi:MAG: AAA family ATPase [Anaerolineae bacterium]|nr:AAA family ATPase [Anaerolineae bacterium]